MQSIRELYEESVKHEHISLAHYIIHLHQEGKVKLEDDSSSLDLSQADHQKVHGMIEQNYLCFRFIKVFSLKVDDKNFVFIFAKSQDEAIKFFQEKFSKQPKNCHEYPLDFMMARGRQFLTFRDMKKEFDKYPALVCFYEKELAY